MQVTLELPEDLARLFGEDPAGRNRVALEALTVEGLRTGKLTVAQARRLLGIPSRYEMDGFLKAAVCSYQSPQTTSREMPK